MVNPVHLEIELNITGVSLWVVGPEHFNKLAVTTGFGRGNHHAVKRGMTGTMSLQTDLNHNRTECVLENLGKAENTSKIEP